MKKDCNFKNETEQIQWEFIRLDEAEIKTFISLLDLLRVVRNEIECGS